LALVALALLALALVALALVALALVALPLVALPLVARPLVALPPLPFALSLLSNTMTVTWQGIPHTQNWLCWIGEAQRLVKHPDMVAPLVRTMFAKQLPTVAKLHGDFICQSGSLSCLALQLLVMWCFPACLQETLGLLARLECRSLEFLHPSLLCKCSGSTGRPHFTCCEMPIPRNLVDSLHDMVIDVPH